MTTAWPTRRRPRVTPAMLAEAAQRFDALPRGNYPPGLDALKAWAAERGMDLLDVVRASARVKAGRSLVCDCRLGTPCWCSRDADGTVGVF